MIKYCGGDMKVVSVEEAEEWKSSVDDGYQRKYRPAHAKHLSNLICGGEYLATGSVVFVTVRKEGEQSEVRCANGRHTLYAIVMAGIGVRCFVEWFECTTDAEYVKIFHCYDTENIKRSYGDSAKAFLMGRSDELPDVSPTVLNRFRAGVEFLNKLSKRRGVRRTRHAQFNNLTRMREELDVYLWLDGQKVGREILGRASVLAAIIKTFAANPAHCRIFWRQVVSGFFDCPQGQSKYPPKRLHDFLRSVIMFSPGFNSRTRPGKTLLTGHDAYVVCMRCWDAYMDGRDIAQLKVKVKGKLPEPKTVFRGALREAG